MERRIRIQDFLQTRLQYHASNLFDLLQKLNQTAYEWTDLLIYIKLTTNNPIKIWFSLL